MERTNSTTAKNKEELLTTWDETLRQYQTQKKIIEYCKDEDFYEAKKEYDVIERKLMGIKKQIEELVKNANRN